MAHRARSLSSAKLFYGSVTMGERGQVVIPVEARKEYGLQPGDKLLVFRHPHLPGVVLTRVDDVKAMLDELQSWRDLVSDIAAAPDSHPEG